MIKLYSYYAIIHIILYDYLFSFRKNHIFLVYYQISWKIKNVVKSLKLIALLMFVQKLAKFDGGYNYLRLKTEDITFTLEKFSRNSLSTEIIETKIFSKVLSLSRSIL